MLTWDHVSMITESFFLFQDHHATFRMCTVKTQSEFKLLDDKLHDSDKVKTAYSSRFIMLGD